MGRDSRAMAIAEVARLEEAQAKWEAEVVAAVAEGESIRARMGSEVLDDPALAEGMAAALSATSSAAEVARSAASAAGPRVYAAKVAVLELDAAAFDRQAARARADLEAHEARTAELLGLLAEHEGEYAPATELSQIDPHALYVKPMKSQSLKSAVRLAELRAKVLRMVIRGEDPRPTVDECKSIQNGSVYGVPNGEFWPESIALKGGLLPFNAVGRGQVGLDDARV